MPDAVSTPPPPAIHPAKPAAVYADHPPPPYDSVGAPKPSRPSSFDPVRAAFLLVAAVIGVQCLVVLAGSVACLIHPPDLVEGKAQCDAHHRLADLLAEALAAALAFAGFSRRP